MSKEMFSAQKKPSPDVTISVSRNGGVTVSVSDHRSDVPVASVPGYVEECYNELKTSLATAMAAIDPKQKRYGSVFMSADFR